MQKIMPDISAYVQSVLSLLSLNGDQSNYEKDCSYLEDSVDEAEKTSEYQTLVQNFKPLPS